MEHNAYLAFIISNNEELSNDDMVPNFQKLVPISTHFTNVPMLIGLETRNKGSNWCPHYVNFNEEV
jgi:hypothetical protein